jgi:mono/diheme cytochrome c family protein
VPHCETVSKPLELKNMRFGWPVFPLVLSLSLLGQTKVEVPPAVSGKVDFAADVQPILKKRCEACHGAAQQMSGVRFDQRDAALAGGYSGPVILPGKSAESKLIQRVSGAPGMVAMPPSGPRLSAEEIGLLRAWIDAGANWTGSIGAGATTAAASQGKARNSHWAFQPITSPPPPSVSTSAWVRNPVDNFVLSRLDKEHIAPAPEADRRTLYRRVSLDLTGLQPTPEEMRTFLSDKRPDAYEKAVDRLLSSPHFGERLARPWLDRARYADSDGYEKDWVRPFAWRYRQWVIDALNNDMPFDQFTIKQVAGDLLPNASIDDRIATGFHRNTLTNREGGVDNNQFVFEAAIDRANTIAATWMGLTMGCAQCHDHKYDPISQKDYYQLFAFVDKVEESDIDAPLPGEIGPYIKSRDEYRAKRQALLDEYKVPQLQADWERQMLEASANPGKRTDWDLAWDCLLKLTEGGDDGEKIIRIPLEKRTERERDVLTTHFVRNYHFAVGQKVYKELKLDELDKKLKELRESYPQLSQAMTVTESQSAPPSHLRVRGDYRTLGIEVKPNTPAVLPAMATRSGSANRLDLANWLVSPENPLTARVTVNWIWQEFFGRGIVKTTDDFGTRGEKPSHPELLDWLASRFVEDGWSVKQLVRNIVTSSTYRQSSKIRPDLQSKDPDNALLARQSRVRLPAELIRDEALYASGLLTLEVGGKSVKPPQPSGVASLAYGAKSDDSWVESKGDDRYRRGLYIHFQRATPYPLLMNFDAPKAVVAQCKREQSNTALQALNLLNDPVFVEAATALAYRAIAEAPDANARLGAMFEYALNRPATPAELDKFRTSLHRLQSMYERDAQAAKQLAPAELPGITRAETAALVNAATVLLNLDEFITKE